MESTEVRTRKKVQGTEGTIVKGVTKKVSGQVVDSAQSVERFPVSEVVNPAYVGVTGGVTKQPVPFESVSVKISITLPCSPNDPDIRATFDRASLLVEEFIGIELDNALGTTP